MVTSAVRFALSEMATGDQPSKLVRPLESEALLGGLTRSWVAAADRVERRRRASPAQYIYFTLRPRYDSQWLAQVKL